MTTAAIIALLLSVAFFALIVWCAFAMSARNDEADHSWVRCAWCGCYYHERDRVRCEVKPPTAPVVDSHGICPDCHSSIWPQNDIAI